MKLPDAYTLRFHEVLESTNTEARRLAGEGALNRTIVQAGRQTSGRGRYDRSWISEPGNLYASLLLYPDASLEVLSQLSFVTALAAGDAIAKGHMRFKWPNDLLLSGKKTGGILLESGEAKGKRFVIIGLGVNLASHPKNVMYPATHLAAENIQTSPELLLERFASAFDQWYEAWQREGFAPIRTAWLNQAQDVGKKMEVRMPDGTKSGVFAGISENGALLLRHEDGTEQSISAGDVFLM